MSNVAWKGFPETVDFAETSRDVIIFYIALHWFFFILHSIFIWVLIILILA